MRNTVFAPLFLWLAASCTATTSTTGTTVPTTPPTTPPSAPQCVGSISDPPNFTPTGNTELLAQTIGQPLQGKLCMGRTYTTLQPITVYRLWNRSRPYTQHGVWWSLERPTGTIESLRERLEICREWSPLDVLSECTLRAQTPVVYGIGQSARCEGGITYPPSAEMQLYIPNDTRAQPPVIHVENCRELPPITQ